MDPFIGQIVMFGGSFAPRAWALCDGQLLAIAQNNALFSILGTTYGGDGRTTFGLPDLRGRVPIHAGNGAGLSNYRLGQKGGAENVTLTEAQLPPHQHTINAVAGTGNTSDPTAAHFANTGDWDNEYSTAPVTVTMNPGAVASAGSGQQHPNVQPYQVINFIIALQGTYPSRS